MALIIEIKAVPSSGKRGCKWDGNQLKCFLKEAPEKGKANKELIAYIAKKLRIPKGAVTILSGATKRKKRLQIDAEISIEQLCDALEIERQMTLF